jgi:predicted ATPase
MHRVVLTGGPGAGKTTLLAELAAAEHSTVSESAREVIAERLARGHSPRPEPEAFAREILRRDIAKYNEVASGAFIFFDRCVVEAIAMVHEVAPIPELHLQEMLARYRFHQTVFVLPPWQAIYRTDTERDHSFAHSQRVHGNVVQWYRQCGYKLYEVPRVGVAERARHVLRVLTSGEA